MVCEHAEGRLLVQMNRRFFALEAPRPQEPAQYSHGAPIFGRGNDKYRYGLAEWADPMIWDVHYEELEGKHRIKRMHRGQLSIALASPAAVGDFVWTWFNECILTERVRDLFVKEEFTGFEVEPVKVAKIKRKSKRVSHVPPLFELLVYGMGGPPDPESGSILLKGPDEKGFVVYSSFNNGLIVNERTWDGSDFFTVEGHNKIIVSERVKDIIVRKGLTNCMLIPVENLVWPSSLETHEARLQREEADKKRREMGLETSTERAVREIQDLREQGAIGPESKTRPSCSKKD
jgi:hypothetical protein